MTTGLTESIDRDGNKTASCSAPCEWPQVALGDMGDIFCGQSPPTATVNENGDGVPYVSGPEQWNGQSINLHKWTTAPKRLVPAGCVFITVKGAGVGTVFAGVEAAIGRDIYAVKPKEHVSARFLEHALRFTASEIIRSARGDIPGLSKHHLATHRIALPPLDEQHRVVAQIEQQFTRLDAGVASLKRVQVALKRYRASVLKAACEGRLVPTEAELARQKARSYEPATELLKRILKERRLLFESAQLDKFERAGKTLKNRSWKAKYKEPVEFYSSDFGVLELPEGWSCASLDTLLREPLRNGHSAKATGNAFGVRTFTLSAVTEGDFSERNTKTTIADASKVTDLWCEPGDIYIERSNAQELVGLARLYKGPSRFAIIPDLLIRVRLAPSVLPPFVELFLLSHSGRHYLRSNAQGISGSMPKIDQGVVQRARIPMPPLAEQHRIVAEADRRFSVIHELEALVEANLKRAERLRQSILQNAFTARP